ncbi:UNVERIFIED_CONTAM: hypothetical protein K2H54_056176 [Gekko kuhli]
MSGAEGEYTAPIPVTMIDQPVTEAPVTTGAPITRAPVMAAPITYAPFLLGPGFLGFYIPSGLAQQGVKAFQARMVPTLYPTFPAYQMAAVESDPSRFDCRDSCVLVGLEGALWCDCAAAAYLGWCHMAELLFGSMSAERGLARGQLPLGEAAAGCMEPSGMEDAAVSDAVVAADAAASPRGLLGLRGSDCCGSAAADTLHLSWAS